MNLNIFNSHRASSQIRWLALFTVLTLTACGGGESETTQNPYTMTNNISNISSSITNTNYRLDIYLPESYESDGSALPVIYSSDGQSHSDSYSAALNSHGAQAILVSIHEGPAGRRNIDYLTPGIYKYFEFLTQELIPFIESSYNASSDYRTIVGHSYGGAMSVYAMFIDDIENQYFSNYVAADPSVARYETVLTDENNRYQFSTIMHANLILTGASIGGNATGVSDFAELMLARNYQGLTIQHSTITTNHARAALDTFKLALIKLFPNE